MPPSAPHEEKNVLAQEDLDIPAFTAPLRQELKALEERLREQQQETLCLFIEELKANQFETQVTHLEGICDALEKRLEEREVKRASLSAIQDPSQAEAFPLKSFYRNHPKPLLALMIGGVISLGLSPMLIYYSMRESQGESRLRSELVLYGSLLKKAWPHLSPPEKEKIKKFSQNKSSGFSIKKH